MNARTKRSHLDLIVAVAVPKFRSAYVFFASNRAKSSKENIELLRLWKLRLEKATLRRLRTRGLCAKRHAQDRGLRRVSLQVKVEQLQQEFAVLRSKCRADVPLERSYFLKLQDESKAAQSVGVLPGASHDALQHGRYNKQQRVQQNKRSIQRRTFRKNQVWFFGHE